MKRVLRVVGVVIGVGVVLAAVCGGVLYWQPLWVNDEIIRYHLWRQHVESKYVEVDGHRIHYFEALDAKLTAKTPGHGRPLVLVHGLGSRGEDWSPLIPGLAAAGFHVYAPDLLGFGRSAQPNVNYSISLQEKTVVDFMDVMKIGRADVGGWSMGGWIALKLTADHPEKVDRLVVYDAAGVYFPPTFDASLFTPDNAADLARLQRMLSPAPKPLPGFAERAAIRRLQHNGWVIERSVALMEGGKDLLDFRLGEIRRPVLVVWGALDQLIPLAVGQTIHRDVAGSSLLIVDGCGHLVAGECSKPVLKGTLDFLTAEPAVKGVEARVDGAVK